MTNEPSKQTNEALLHELEDLRFQLTEANETIEAIRTGQVDALVVQGQQGHQLYTLKSADQTYRVFIEKMTEGAVTLNAEGLILYCNSRFAAMVQRPLSQVIGMPFAAFVENKNQKEYKELFEKCWFEDCKGEINLNAGHTLVPVLLSLTTLELEEGQALSIILTDLTSQKQAQQQLEENNRQLEASNHDLQQFASIASHDLQEPLRKIQIFAHLLQNKSTGLSPELQAYLQKIIEASARMKVLIIDVLDYSKLSAENFSLQATDLNELIKELCDDFELPIAEKNAQIVTGPLPSLCVNRGQLRQVFQNIISNALKFSKAHVPPVISIQATRIAEKSFASPQQKDGSYCFITVQDNGIGFEEKYATTIFSLFERLNAKDKYEGTGIGLAIAKRIIEKHQGLISAVSAEGRGATFQIILPFSQTKA